MTSIFAVSTAQAYFSVNETGEILPENYFNIHLAPQMYLSDGGGVDMGVGVDTHVFNSTDARIMIGAGKIDFWTQASLKWVPFPDVGNQPAMGIRAALGYSRDEDVNTTHVQLAPIFSKKSNTSSGDMIPYVSVPFTFVTNKYDSYTATQLAVGSQWFPWRDANFGAEFNLNLKNSLSSLSVYFNFPFEGATGYKRYE